jgi:hypothetical protein
MDCARFCQKSRQCTPELTEAECNKACTGIQLSSACIDQIVATDCTELAKDLSENPSYADACFPTCTNEGQVTCSGAWASMCNEGREVTLSCAYACSQSGMTFSGTCGPTYQAQTCSNGGDCCWCQ